jgi:2-keto-4-pentenoate hydratase
MQLLVNGRTASLGVGAACLEHPLAAAAWLARKMVEAGTPLAAGDVVLTGALGPMVSVSGGEVAEARIAGLGSVRIEFGRRG